MNCILAYVFIAASQSKGSLSFLMDGQPGNLQEVTHELFKLQTEVAILKDMVANLQESCPSCAVSTRQPAPAFSAILTSESITCSTDAPIVFNKELLDTRMAYDVRHGTFRAPV
ncbi:hypothetical protein DPMN_073856 [Dreissena polymorpha]|uniref:C1q domain-containing protein n=1 Tax=Dreissena polymorpha TaxID=45954 RepID=A0A9D4BL23_DREPO|nr:hypothetical protein DPMN_073856 [Dreissena polymorpha]